MANPTNEQWPTLDYQDWKETYQTLHRWTQIVGKLALYKADCTNHSWHSVLYVTPVGLTTPPFFDGERSLSVEFDFSRNQLLFRISDGQRLSLPLVNETVASFFDRFLRALDYLKIDVSFDPHPNELPDAIAFSDDTFHGTYRLSQVQDFWKVMIKADHVLKRFRSDFVGKCSPVHFFWGSFDLAVTRFSGRTAPIHPGGIPHLPDRVTREAYSHEVSSCGFWPGNEFYPYAAFYSYAYPEPAGFSQAHIEPEAAFYHKDLHEFILPYESVRNSVSPETELMRFFQSTYAAAASLGNWDRQTLENSPLLAELKKSLRSTEHTFKHPDARH